jgi:hypothetical protein
MVRCNFCNEDFKNNKTLTAHKKNAKYCIEKQKKDLLVEFKCEKCDKVLSSKQRLKSHSDICNIKPMEIILLEEQNKILVAQNLEYKLQIQDLQNKLENLAKQAINKPTTLNTTNNTTNNILNLAPLDMNALKEQLSDIINTKMTEEHVIEGQEGIAKLVSCCFTTDDGKKLITCSDVSRGVWKSKDKNGNIIKDYKANNIAKVIKPLATLKANELIEIDDIKRKKIYEVICIKKRRKERLEKEKFEMATQRGYKKNSIEYNMCEDRMQKRFFEQKEDNEIEKEIIDEFKKSNELYLLDLPEDIDKPYKMYLGKKDIVEMGDDSSKFSSKLITLV